VPAIGSVRFENEKGRARTRVNLGGTMDTGTQFMKQGRIRKKRRERRSRSEGGCRYAETGVRGKQSGTLVHVKDNVETGKKKDNLNGYGGNPTPIGLKRE